MSEPLHDPAAPPAPSPFEPVPGLRPETASPAGPAPAPPSMRRGSVKGRLADLTSKRPHLPRRARRTVAPPQSPLGPIGLPGWQPAPAAPAARPDGAPTSRWARVRRSRTFGAAVTSVMTAAVMLALHQFAFQPFSVPSASMQPTLDVGDRFLVEKLSYRTGSPARGDIVVFSGAGSWDEPGQEQVYVKRVIAVAGDTVSCCDSKGRVVVNGAPSWEGYVLEDDHRPFGPVAVPEGYVWVMGDHRKVSGDSRDHGLVPVEQVVGRGIAKVWPLTHVGTLPRG